MSKPFAKIFVDLSPIVEDGWPPADVESLWAEDIGDGLYRVDNVPIFARGLAVDDIVRAAARDGILEFIEVVRSGGHSTYRVILATPNRTLEEPPVLEYWQLLADLGCSYEGYTGGPALFAIDVPAPAVVRQAWDVLTRGEAAQMWDFEEGKAAL